MSINLDLEHLAHTGLIDPSWVEPLSPVQDELRQIENRLNNELAHGHELLPSPGNIMRAFQLSFDAVRVVIVGQDPYPTPGDAVGLAFSISPHQQSIPRSLANIFTELTSDLGCPAPASGDLSVWASQGVMLLNQVLTVRAHDAGSHRGLGWEKVTEHALAALDARSRRTLCAVLWGKDAQQAKSFLPLAHVIESAHPSPLSASRGFFDSRPFSQVNQALVTAREEPIQWCLPAQPALFE